MLHEVASKHNDADMTNFIEEKLLQEQAETVKKVSELVSQLRRIGKVCFECGVACDLRVSVIAQGHAVWHFDKELQ